MDYMKKNGEEFCKDIVDVISGSEINLSSNLPQTDEVKTMIKIASKKLRIHLRKIRFH